MIALSKILESRSERSGKERIKLWYLIVGKGTWEYLPLIRRRHILAVVASPFSATRSVTGKRRVHILSTNNATLAKDTVRSHNLSRIAKQIKRYLSESDIHDFQSQSIIPFLSNDSQTLLQKLLTSWKEDDGEDYLSTRRIAEEVACGAAHAPVISRSEK